MSRAKDSVVGQEASHRDETSLSSMSVMSFNVWFSEYHWETRLGALVDLIAREKAHVVCLQEVTPWFLSRLMEFAIVRQKFRLVGSFGTRAWYGVCMLIDKVALPLPTIDIVSLPSQMGRTALVCAFSESTCRCGRDDDLAIATVHLESLKNRNLREKQLNLIFPAIAKYSSALLVGDFNITSTGPWADAEEEERLHEISQLNGFRDWWDLKGKSSMDSDNAREDNGVTVCTKQNLMLAAKSRFRVHARYDRAFLKESTTRKGSDIAVVGRKAVSLDHKIETPIYISDHFGLTIKTFVSNGVEEG